MSTEFKNFDLLEKRMIKEIGSNVSLYEHKKTKAKLVHFDNDDINKIFAIGFKTLPEDSSGVAHILEHSVLNGSRKFPVKEPFVELLKGSLNTFVNAITWPDKTLYPVASKNSKDFNNMMDVYLDAVFYPEIYNKPEIFSQEGWSFKLDNPDDELRYNGVVYNEMKGAYSDPNRNIYTLVGRHLYRDTHYKNCSGGNPEIIPNLTYDKFIDFHRKFYHPSNSYISLYGKGIKQRDIDLIDSYLSGFDYKECDFDITYQKNHSKALEIEEFYSINKGESDEGKSFVAKAFITGDHSNSKELLALEILNQILFASKAAPLREALIKNDCGKDITAYISSSYLQPAYMIVAKNSSRSRVEEFNSIFNRELNSIVENGIDRDLIESSINRIEFELRDRDSSGSTPKSVLHIINAIQAMVYNQSPFDSLSFENYIKEIREEVNKGFFENLIRKYLINNTNSLLIKLHPKAGLNREKEEALSNKLKKYKESLSKEDLERIVESSIKLDEFKNREDKKEDLEKLPLLNIEDISKDPELIPNEISTIDGVTYLYQNLPTNGINYLNLFFDASVIAREDVKYFKLFSALLTEVDTADSTYDKLNNKIDFYTGGISFNSEIFPHKSDKDKVYPKLNISSKALHQNSEKLMAIIKEIVSGSRFDDKERIRELINKMKSKMQMMVMNSGHIIGLRAAGSSVSPVSAFNNDTGGAPYYIFLREILEDFDNRFTDLKSKFEEIKLKVFSAKNLVVSITSDNNESLKEGLTDFIKSLGVREQEHYSYTLNENIPLKLAYKIPSQIQFVCQAVQLESYKDNFKVLNKILRLSYLWNRVRVKGGAYGAFSIISRPGYLYFGSYRDPNITQTLEAYSEAEEYVKDIHLDSRELTKIIIGTISDLDSAVTISEKSNLVISRFFSNISDKDLIREREAVLNTTLDQIKSMALQLNRIKRGENICVVGSDSRIMENESLFDRIESIIK